MRIAVDAMGGDYAPAPVVAGALQAAREDGIEILLVGPRDRLERDLVRLGGTEALSAPLEVVHAAETVGMNEPPAAALRHKKDSSLRVCAELVKEGRAQAMVTAGNTGAAMVLAKVILGTLPGVDRPALAAVMPSIAGRTVLLDVGANVDSKPAHLREFAVMGHFYAQEVLGVRKPTIGLLSIGEEENKGSDLIKEVFKVLQGTGLHFVGNVEGSDIFNGTIDVVVCDGFVGNVVLKSAESLADLFGVLLREEIEASWRARLGYRMARPALESFRQRTDYAEYGAAPLLGVVGGCFIGHGRSNERAIHNAVRSAWEFAAAEVHEKIRAKVEELHTEEVRVLGRWRARWNR